MPKLTNNGATDAPLPLWGGQSVEPGQTINLAVYPDKVPAGLDLTDHLLSPFKGLHAAAPPASLTELAQYKALKIANTSGDEITCTINGDSGNTFVLVNGEITEWTLGNRVWSLAIAGTGSGNVIVTATRKDQPNEGVLV